MGLYAIYFDFQSSLGTGPTGILIINYSKSFSVHLNIIANMKIFLTRLFNPLKRHNQ